MKKSVGSREINYYLMGRKRAKGLILDHEVFKIFKEVAVGLSEQGLLEQDPDVSYCSFRLTEVGFRKVHKGFFKDTAIKMLEDSIEKQIKNQDWDNF